MSVADVKCLQATRQTAPNSRTSSANRQSFCLRSCCAYVAPRTCYQRKTKVFITWLFHEKTAYLEHSCNKI